MPVSSDQALADLRPFLPRIAQCLRDALNEYVTEYAAVRHKHSRRTRSSTLHDLMVRQLDAAFPFLPDRPVPDVMVMVQGNLNLLVALLGKYKIRIKKMDRHHRTRNIPTEASLSFDFQQQAFPEIPDATNLNLGYQPLDDASLLTSRLWLTCPDGARLRWVHELPEARDARAKPTDLRPHRHEPVIGAKKRRATLKRDQLKKRTKPKKRAEGDDDDNEQGGR